MGKTYRKDAKNDRWRKAKQQKSQKKFRPNIPIQEEDEPPFDNCDRTNFLR